MTDIIYDIDHVLLSVDYNDPDKHKHLAKQLVISLQGYINCVVEEKAVSCQGIFIDSSVEHTIESHNKAVLVFLFDETTDIAKEIQEKYLKDCCYFVLDNFIVEKICEIWKQQIAVFKSEEEFKISYHHSSENIFHICGLDVKQPHIQDDRIKKVLEILHFKEEISESTIAELAKAVCLSQSRLSHLFKQETKISINSFLVIMKIIKTYEYIAAGKSITEASIKAGFNSSSHFAATNKNLFGISANQIRKSVRLIKI